MSFMIPIALYGWPILVVALFGMLPPRRAVLVAFIGGYLLLPMAGYTFTGLPAYTKVTATAYGVLLGVIAFDFARVMTFRFRLLDLPMAIWCLVPFASSVTNGLGAYDGLSAVFIQIMTWGVPYLMGRLYLNDLEGLRELAIAIFIGGLIYVPLCLIEIRLSPRLHIWVYGFHQHSWRQSSRFGGWRPTVFMQHGLAVAFWMVTSGLVGYWLWRSKAMLRLLNIPMAALVAVVLGVGILCRSAGAVVLLIAGIAMLEGLRRVRMKWIPVALALAPILYMGVRAPGIWDASHLLNAVQSIPMLDERTESFQYRLDAENILAEHAMRQPVFGWGAWGRNRPSNLGHEADAVATDGLWIIAFGQRGAVGLAALTAAMLLPILLIIRRLPAQAWWHPQGAPIAALCAVVILFMIDSLFNAMLSPVFVLVVGGLTGWLVTAPVRRGAEQRARTPRAPAPVSHAMSRGIRMGSRP